MSELHDSIRNELLDPETRHIYADDLLNSYLATQIKVLREQRGWTQQQLADAAGMKQARISVLEDVNYPSWTAGILKRLAQAFDVRLSIKFEEFNSFIEDFRSVKRELLERLPFADDPGFNDPAEETGADVRLVNYAIDAHAIEVSLSKGAAGAAARTLAIHFGASTQNIENNISGSETGRD